jgi:hypothetical protein
MTLVMLLAFLLKKSSSVVVSGGGGVRAGASAIIELPQLPVIENDCEEDDGVEEQ